MKILTATGLTKLIQLIKSSFLSSSNTVTASTLDVDTTPTANSSNLITSGGVQTALAGKIAEPTSDGTSGQVLTTNGSGGRSWTTVSGGTTSLAIGTVTTLPAGNNATASINNNQLNLGLPTGATGEKGDTGDAGTAATVTVGTVTTLAAGASATVTNTGTTSAAVLNFGIPKGADGSGGTGTGSNITECSDSFEYYNGSTSTTHYNGSSPYPAELAHYAGLAMRAYNTDYASSAGYTSYASSAYAACYASYAYSLYGGSSSESSASTAIYASWAGPCYGNFDSSSTPDTSYASSKACLYETNSDNQGYTITICPLPPLGPFIVDLGLAWTINGTAYSAKYILHGNNLQFTKYTKVSGDSWMYQDGVNCYQAYFNNFSISNSMLTVYRIVSTNNGCCCVSYTATITATAIVTGQFGDGSCCGSCS